MSLSLSLNPAGQLMQAEEKGSGSVSWSVYKAYIRAAGGALAFIINIVLFLLTTGSITFSNWWLSYWIKQGSGVRYINFPENCKKRVDPGLGSFHMTNKLSRIHAYC